MKTQSATECRCPVPTQTSYKASLKEIVYRIEDSYDSLLEWTHRMVAHSIYRQSGSFNPVRFLPFDDIFIDRTPYAFGLLANPFKTNVITLDFDEATVENVMDAVERLGDMPIVQEIDIAISSRYNDFELTPKGYHVWAGLNGYHNVLGFYRSQIPGACKGYNNCVLSKQEMVLRVSKKFKDPDKNAITDINWTTGYSRKDRDTWLKYTSQQLIAPLTTADGVLSNTTPLRSKPRLKMRG